MDMVIFGQPIKTTYKIIKLDNGNIPRKINFLDDKVLGDCGIPEYEEIKIFPCDRIKRPVELVNFDIGDYIGVLRHYVGTNDLMFLAYKIVKQIDSDHVIVQQARFD